MRASDKSGDVILGVDIGGTKTALIAVACESGDIIANAQIATPCGMPARELIETLRRELTDMLARSEHTGEVRAVGCAVPGQVDGDGVVIGAGNLGWDTTRCR